MEAPGTQVTIHTPPGEPNKQVEAQRFYLSKTVIFNAITTIIGIFELADIINVLPSQYDGAPIMIVGVCNVILRVWFTNSPVTR